jgi:sugar phosphate isomerase/epimerase
MRLGLDSYTLRWQGWDAFQLIEYCAALGLDAVQLSGRRHFASLEEASLLPAKRHADELGILIELGMGSVDQYSTAFRPEYGPAEEQLTAMLRAAALVGSPSLHVVLGGRPERSGPTPLAQHIDECVRVAKVVAPLARDLGIRLAFENHGDLLARELAALVEAAGPDYVGVCLDTGNPALAAEDPVLTTEVLARYTVTSHIRDSRVWAVPEGAMVQHVPMGQGDVDFHRIVALLTEQSPEAIFSLETLTAHAPRPAPYFDADSGFWELYPAMLARDFARFVALAQRGQAAPFEQVLAPPGSQMPPDGPLGQELIAQQRRHFEESVRYCRDVLGLGERGR